MGKGIVLKLLENFQKNGDLQNLALLSALILGCETKIIQNIYEVNQSRQLQNENFDQGCFKTPINLQKTKSSQEVPTTTQPGSARGDLKIPLVQGVSDKKPSAGFATTAARVQQNIPMSSATIKIHYKV